MSFIFVPTIEDAIKYKEYLIERYSKNTARQYWTSFKRLNKFLKTEELMNQFLATGAIKPRESSIVYHKKRDNPFYVGWIKSVITCFDLDFTITKSLEKKSKEKLKHKFLTKDQVDYIINNTPARISLIVQLYFETGLRLRELMNIKLENINLDLRVLIGVGKMQKPFEVKFSSTAKERIKKLLIYNKLEYPFRDDDSNKDHGGAFYYRLKKECDKIGILNVHPHRLRHALGHFLSVDMNWNLIQRKVAA